MQLAISPVSRLYGMALGYADPNKECNPYALTLFKTVPDLSGDDNYDACKAMLRYCMVPHKEVHDIQMTMRVSKGKINPGSGFVIQSANNDVLYSFFDLIDWIKTKGMVPM